MLWPTLVMVVLVVGQSGAGPPPPPWWGSSVYYRVLVDSFKDSDGDGLGDLKGVTKQLSYVKAVGADAVILSPISARSPDCGRPGLVDFVEVDRRYGDLDAFNSLLEKAKTLELKVVITLPLQTVSVASEWFNSSAGGVAGFEDRLLWKEGDPEDTPPSEDTITWIWHEPRNAYYGSTNNESVLNLCSEAVSATLSSAQCAWLRRGVAGVLLNPDHPRNQECGEKLLRKMAAEAISCARSANLNLPVVLVETSLPPEEAAGYYSDGGVGASSVLSNAMTSSTRKSAPQLALAFHAALLNAPQDTMPTWMTSAPGESRLTTRLGSDMIDAINLLALVLPGAAIIQQGDELGAADTILEWAPTDSCYPSPAVPSSAPFPWDDTVNAGFTSGTPWLPLPPNYRYANAKSQFTNEFTHAGMVRVAAALRKSPAMGPHFEIKRLNGAVAILRWGAAGSLIVLSNVGREQTESRLSRIPGIPPHMTVASSSSGSSQAAGSHIPTDRALKLAPGETVLLVGPPRHCGGPGPVDKIASKISEGWQKVNKYFGDIKI